MRDTTIFEKLVPSIINAVITVTLSVPFYFLFGYGIEWKLSVIGIFYILQVIDTHENRHFSCFGMRIFGSVWEKSYSRFQRNCYSLLYTLSFSSLFFSVYFPFDLFLANMLLLQIPSILITQTTFHGLIAGGLKTKVKM